MLVPRKMKKVRIYSVMQNEEAILSALHDLGIFQVEPVSISAELVSSIPQSESYAKLSELSRKIRDLEISLYPNESVEKKLFKSVKELVDAAEQINIYDEVKSLKESEGSALSSLKILNESKGTLEKISFYDGDLGYLNGTNVSSYVTRNDEVTSEKLRNFGKLFLFTGKEYLIAVVSRYDQSKFGELCKNEKIDVTPVPVLTGTVKDSLSSEETKREETQTELNGIRDKIGKISKENYATVAAIREQLEIELKKIDVTSKLSGTEKALIMEGWVPSDQFEIMTAALHGVTDDEILIEEVETEETPPTSLKNPNGIKLFQFFIRFYSLPQSIEIDPTLIFALIFPIFFGLMIGDVGYGLTILIMAVWLIRRLDHPPKNSHVPKFLSRFVLMMMSKRSLKILAKAMLPGAIIAIALGIIFDSYFGFTFPTYERLRRGLGLRPSSEALVRPAGPTTFTETHLSRLAACVVVRRQVSLGELAMACGVSLPAVRESLPSLQPRLAACGLQLVEDSVGVTVVPSAESVAALAALDEVVMSRELSSAALEVLSWVGYRGAATRREVETARRQDSAALLSRLEAQGYLASVAEVEAPGQPHRYRLTTHAIAVLGFASLEELQAALARVAGERERR